MLLYSKGWMPIHAIWSKLPPWTWRCNDPICPQGTLKFHLMCSNEVIQTLLKDSVLQPKPDLSAVVTNFNRRDFIRSFSRSMNNTSLMWEYLEAFKVHWHFHCNTFAIINRANFFTVINNGLEDSVIEPHIKLRSLKWLSWMNQLRLLSRTMEGQCDRYIRVGEQLSNGLIRVISNEWCESETSFSIFYFRLLVCYISEEMMLFRPLQLTVVNRKQHLAAEAESLGTWLITGGWLV